MFITFQNYSSGIHIHHISEFIIAIHVYHISKLQHSTSISSTITSTSTRLSTVCATSGIQGKKTRERQIRNARPFLHMLDYNYVRIRLRSVRTVRTVVQGNTETH